MHFLGKWLRRVILDQGPLMEELHEAMKCLIDSKDGVYEQPAC